MPTVIEGAYLRDLLDQPAAIERAAHWLRNHPPELPPLDTFRRIVLTGMGSSYFALYPLHLRLLALGRPSMWVETSELIHYQPRLLDEPTTLLIAVSQSGRSAEIVHLVRHWSAREFGRLLAVTNDESSPLAHAAHVRLLMHAGPEATVSCKTYVASLAQLAWLGHRLSGNPGESCCDELHRAASQARDYLDCWREHVDDAGRHLDNVTRLFLAGRGPSLSAALTGGLIVKESTRFAAEGMSAAAFRHGPMEVLDPTVAVALLQGLDATAHLNRGLIADVTAAGATAIPIGTNADGGVGRIPATPASTLPLLEILPVQMITLALAARAGVEAGRFTRATKVTDIE